MSYLSEVERSLSALSKRQSPAKWLISDYVGGGESKLRYLEIKTPVSRARFKQGYSFSDRPAKDQWKIWDEIWHEARCFDVMNHALYWVETRARLDLFEEQKRLLTWQKRVDNWGHSDALSSFYARFVEHDQKTMLGVLERWSLAKNPWDNRQSLVSAFYYSRLRKKFVPYKTAIKLIERQLGHEHYYVQKGVGWTLRETFNVYPRETFAYLKTVARDLSPHAWTAATEKLTASQKQLLKSSRT